MGAVAITMALFWIFEVMPLGITALLPLVCYPFLGILSTKKIAPIYMSSTLMLFIGGFFVAIAMQKWNLHKRIALRIIKLFGSSPTRVLLGFMSATWFLSMWISNTATTVMMVSIGLAIISSVETLEKDQNQVKLFSSALMLAIAYSATVGGMATLVGTPPNLAFSRIYAMSFPDVAEMSFGQWMLYGLPASFFIFFVVFGALYTRFLRKTKLESLDANYIDQELKNLGPVRSEEKAIFVVFFLMAFLWIFRKPLELGFLTVPSWSQFLETGNLFDDGTIAILCTLILYLIPSENKPGKRILEAEEISKIPWQTLLLFGGGFALAKGMAASGLSVYLGNQFKFVAELPLLYTMLSLSMGMSFLTELTSNMASTEMILPILVAIAKAKEIDPLYLMIPTTLAASCAFMLPAATAPNAIIFSSGKIDIKTMLKTGFVINIISFSIISVWIYFVI